jgi:hypothetical protein
MLEETVLSVVVYVLISFDKFRIPFFLHPEVPRKNGY